MSARAERVLKYTGHWSNTAGRRCIRPDSIKHRRRWRIMWPMSMTKGTGPIGLVGDSVSSKEAPLPVERHDIGQEDAGAVGDARRAQCHLT